MQLTRFSDYALRTLLYLGARPGEWVPVSAISEAHGISTDHTIKAAKWLTQRGYVEAQRGKNGGLRLARGAEDLRIGALIRETEPHVHLLECFDKATNTCRLAPACALKSALFRAREAFFEVLDEQSLGDLLHDAPTYQKLLQIRRP